MFYKSYCTISNLLSVAHRQKHVWPFTECDGSFFFSLSNKDCKHWRVSSVHINARLQVDVLTDDYMAYSVSSRTDLGRLSRPAPSTVLVYSFELYLYHPHCPSLFLDQMHHCPSPNPTTWWEQAVLLHIEQHLLRFYCI